MKRYCTQKSWFFLCLSQKPFCPFWENTKNILKFNLKFSFGRFFLWKRKVLQIFKKYSFLRSLWFFENKNFGAPNEIRRYFGIELIGSNMPNFKYRQKVIDPAITFQWAIPFHQWATLFLANEPRHYHHEPHYSKPMSHDITIMSHTIPNQ